MSASSIILAERGRHSDVTVFMNVSISKTISFPENIKNPYLNADSDRVVNAIDNITDSHVFM